MKKQLISFLMLVGLLFLAACGNTKQTEATDTAKDKPSENKQMEPTGEEFTIGVLPAESAIPMILAKEKGFFEEEGVNVSIKSFSHLMIEMSPSERRNWMQRLVMS